MRPLVLLLSLLAVPAAAHAQMATVARNAPIYETPEAAGEPVRVAAPGTRLRVVQDEGEWLQIEFTDPELGRRLGWVQRAHLVDDALTPQDLSVPESGPRRLPRPLPPGFGPGYFEEYPLFETAIGWSYLRLSPGGDFDDLDSIDAPLGWNISVAGNQTHWLGFVGDASGHYKDDFVLEGDRSMIHTVMGGVRASLRTKSVIVPFGQFLAGLVWSHVELAGEREGSLDFAIQPGGGIDVGDGDVAARVEVGWRRVFYEDFVVEAPYKNQFRLVVGVVVRSF